MKIVADTHSLFWYFIADKRLSKIAKENIDKAENILIPTIVLAELLYIFNKKRRQDQFYSILAEFKENSKYIIVSLDLGIKENLQKYYLVKSATIMAMAKFHYKDTPTEKQKKSFAKYLSEDEELVLVTSFSKAYIRSKFIIYLIFPGLLLAGIGLGLGWFLGFSKVWTGIFAGGAMILSAILKTMHTFHANRYLLTTRRIIIKKGIFGVKLTATLFDKITHLEVDQTIVDRLLLHHGNIIINTAGVTKGEIVLKYVDYPLELKNLLERLINREREQFGLRSAPLQTVEGEIIS